MSNIICTRPAIRSVVAAYLGTGKIKPLAVTGPKRLARLPDVPTTAEVGLPGFEFSVWFALFTPRGVPRDVLQRLNGEVLKALAAKEVQEAFAKQGMEPAGSSPEQLEEFMAREIPRWKRAVQVSGAKVE